MLTFRTSSCLAVLGVALAGCPSSSLPDVPDVVDAGHPADVNRDVVEAAMDADVVSDIGSESAADVVDAAVLPDVPPTDVPVDAPPGPPFCSLGTDVPGATVPAGFCLRRFASVGQPRVLLFAPNGDLFVSAPTDASPGGGNGGPGSIVVLTDDNHDGTAEVGTFARSIPDVHGLAMGAGFLYYTTAADVFRTPYSVGQRREIAPDAGLGMRERYNMPMSYQTGGRWTHGLARSVGGTLYTSHGEFGACGATPGGQIAQIAIGSRTVVADGFRNPMYMRCHFRDEACIASELGEDQTTGAREKLVLLRPGTHYGYSCCFTQNLPMTPVCAAVTPEESSFPIGNTPFGLDWERGTWPASHRDGLFVALHGSFYTTPPWQDAGIVYAATNPTTHVPTGAFMPFVGGFGPGGSPLDRPSDVAFAPDGRMFFSDDLGNAVYWVAPTTLRMPAL